MTGEGLRLERDGAVVTLVLNRPQRQNAIDRATWHGLAQRCDVIVLAQASMAHLEEPIKAAVPVPVLSSPRLCVEAAAARLS